MLVSSMQLTLSMQYYRKIIVTILIISRMHLGLNFSTIVLLTFER